MGSSQSMVINFKENMIHKFEMIDLGLLHYFLSLEVNQRPGSILISQKRYAKALLKNFGMMNNKSQPTPLNTNWKLQLEDNSGKADENRFQSMFRSILYLTHTHPNLMFTIGLISKFVQNPTKHHLGTVKRVLHYVSGTINTELKYECVEDFRL